MKSILSFLAALIVAGCTNSSPTAAADAQSGSGYADLDGSFINYSYEDFGGFALTWANNKVRWDAMHGYYVGMQAETVPQVSKVAEGIYFTSWGTGAGGDNVVHNFNSMTVNAHLNARYLWIPMDNIYGVIHCRDTPDCVRTEDPMRQNNVSGATILAQNAARLGLPPRRRRSLYITDVPDADVAARAELAGAAIVYTTPFGTTRIEVDGVETGIKEDDGDVIYYPSNATKIADEIYFISWAGELGGNHVVFNRQSMQAFDHIWPTGERAELIYEITCFDAESRCE